MLSHIGPGEQKFTQQQIQAKFKLSAFGQCSARTKRDNVGSGQEKRLHFERAVAGESKDLRVQNYQVHIWLDGQLPFQRRRKVRESEDGRRWLGSKWNKMHKSLPHRCSDLMFIVAQCTILTTYWFPKISKNHALENGTLFHWRHILWQSFENLQEAACRACRLGENRCWRKTSVDPLVRLSALPVISPLS